MSQILLLRGSRVHNMPCELERLRVERAEVDLRPVRREWGSAGGSRGATWGVGVAEAQDVPTRPTPARRTTTLRTAQS
jgi:hypothetical protein